MLVAEPGRFQVQPALQPQAGGLADGPVVVQPGEFGVLGGVQGASQVTVGQATRLRRLVAVDPGAGAPDPGLQAGPGPDQPAGDRKSTRLNSSHMSISYAV